MRAAMCNPGSVCGGMDLTAARYIYVDERTDSNHVWGGGKK